MAKGIRYYQTEGGPDAGASPALTFQQWAAKTAKALKMDRGAASYRVYEAIRDGGLRRVETI